MKLHAEADGNKYEVEIERVDRRVVAKIDGRRYDLEVSEPENGIYLFKREGKIFEASVSDDPSASATARVRIGQSEILIRISDPKRLRAAAASDATGDGPAEIKTAMPGKVVRILLEVGAEVEKGDGIIVVEAMKMQNELKAPKKGVVKEIRVAEGTTVAAGETLATVE